MVAPANGDAPFKKMKITRHCLNCNKKFSTELSKNEIKIGHGVYCSRSCSSEDTSRKRIGKPKLSSRNNWPAEDITLSNGSIIFWTRKFYRNNDCRVHISCGSCFRERTILANHVQRQEFVGLCQKCSRRVNAPKGKDHKNWRGGKFIGYDGYVIVNIRSLSGRSFEIASQMARVIHGKPAIVSEHRLVMAVYLDRPLSPSEVIHHKNGKKTDNRIENLEIVTHADHRKLDVKYYDLWQKALREISIIKEQISKS